VQPGLDYKHEQLKDRLEYAKPKITDTTGMRCEPEKRKRQTCSRRTSIAEQQFEQGLAFGEVRGDDVGAGLDQTGALFRIETMASDFI